MRSRAGQPRRTALRCCLAVSLGLGGLAGATAAYSGPAAPEGCVVPNRTLTLHAVELPSVQGQVRLAYGLTRSTATIPGPTIELVEGDCLALTVSTPSRRRPWPRCATIRSAVTGTPRWGSRRIRTE
jgi:hypothetical protein